MVPFGYYQVLNAYDVPLLRSFQEIIFYEQLKSSPYVVTDPENADYFYLPLWPYWHQKGRYTLPNDAVNHLRKAGPWFDRKKGADHIFAFSGDFGR